MCGIVGVVDIDGSSIKPGLVEKMNKPIFHRGPDDEGIWYGDSAGLGMRRLSILDISGGKQPFFNETGDIVTVFNGEIYNFSDIKDSLTQKGHVIESKCDTAVIPHLYEDFGVEMVQRLRGMFAVAVWDRRNHSLFLARDRLGIKPLYYSECNGKLYFASELKSLSPCGILNEQSKEAIYHFMTDGYIPAPYTIYKNVHKLLPGHYLQTKNKQVKVSRYWEVSFEPDEKRSEEEFVDELHSKLLEAVKIRLISDVPLGAFLSGGVDSSLIVALMCEASSAPVKTFSISFDEKEHNEAPYAQAVSKRFGTEHTEFTVRPDIWKDVEDIVLQFDEPFADSSAIPTYFLCKMTREHVTVALSGDGGDELFAGYDRYHDFLRKRPLYRIPAPIRRAAFGTLTNLLPQGTRGKRFLRSLTLTPFEDYVFGDKEVTHSDLFSEEFLNCVQGIHPTDTGARFFNHKSPCELDSLCRYDIGLYLPDDILTKVDRTSMAVSLEARVPILDHHVVEFAATIPARHKMRDGTGKFILKRLLERYMPFDHVHRKKKGFGIPLDEWFRKELRDDLLTTLSPARIREAGVFNPVTVQSLLDQHMSRKRDHKPLLWRLFVYHLWNLKRQNLTTFN